MIEVIRDTFTTKSTIGRLFFDGEFVCDTLEDVVRSGDDHILEAKEKVYGETAIPEGTYGITLFYWDKYKCKMPLLEGVPLFTGIFIHPGNFPVDSFGCLLVGSRDAGAIDFVGQSRVVFFQKLLPKITDRITSGKKLTITVKSK